MVGGRVFFSYSPVFAQPWPAPFFLYSPSFFGSILLIVRRLFPDNQMGAFAPLSY